MQITSISTIPFLRKSILKTLFKNGELPSVTVGIYGEKLDPKLVTIEHLQPRALKGKSKLANYALANAKENSKRGIDPLLKHTSLDNIKNYFSQFGGVEVREFSGAQYIENCAKTLKKMDIVI